MEDEDKCVGREIVLPDIMDRGSKRAREHLRNIITKDRGDVPELCGQSVAFIGIDKAIGPDITSIGVFQKDLLGEGLVCLQLQSTSRNPEEMLRSVRHRLEIQEVNNLKGEGDGKG